MWLPGWQSHLAFSKRKLKRFSQWLIQPPHCPNRWIVIYMWSRIPHWPVLEEIILELLRRNLGFIHMKSYTPSYSSMKLCLSPRHAATNKSTRRKSNHPIVAACWSSMALFLLFFSRQTLESFDSLESFQVQDVKFLSKRTFGYFHVIRTE